MNQHTESTATAANAFDGRRLRSAFQPIFSLSHRRSVGFEALIRCGADDPEPLAPRELFAGVSDVSKRLVLDAMCQSLHVSQFARVAPRCRWLFLNIDAATITQGRYRDGALADALDRAQLGFDRLVIEVLESEIPDERLLQEAVDYFRARGALVAIDDFGAGHSNFDRIWRLAPDIVKLDGSLIREAAQHRQGRLGRMFAHLVALMHEAGCLVLAEGIETDEHAMIAMDADVDFVQGFHFAQPELAITLDHAHTRRALDSLTRRFAGSAMAADRQARRELDPYTDAFRDAARAFEAGEGMASACRPLLGMARTIRCYLLDGTGEEIAHYAGLHQTPAAAPVSPIGDTRGGIWFRRRYFRDAINDPRHMKVSRAYRSSAGGETCITLSVANAEIPQRVFCCDVRSR